MKTWQKNLILTLASIIVSYTVIEIFVWRNLLHHVPLTLHQSLGRLGYLAQSSKKSVVPEDYVLLIGDSYAEGLGDHLLQVVHKGNPKFNAAHVVHDLTSRDVISFGFRGGYPSETYAFSTYKAYYGMQLYKGLALEPPKDVFVFYFEGNDLNDEMANVRFWLPSSFDKSKATDQAYVDAHMDERAAVGQAASERRWHVFRNAHLFDTATKWIKMSAKNLINQSSALLTAEDPAFRIGVEYRERWARYKQGQSKISAGGKVRNYPSPTIEPFAFHNAEDIRIGTVFFKASLKKVKDLFPRARVQVVYIPTPLMAYRLESTSVQLRDRVRAANSERAGPLTEIPRAQLYEQSNRICRSIEQATLEAGAAFNDSRSFLSENSSEKGYLHGPTDPLHFNWTGYQVLGEFIARSLADGKGTPCAMLK